MLPRDTEYFSSAASLSNRGGSRSCAALFSQPCSKTRAAESSGACTMSRLLCCSIPRAAPRRHSTSRYSPVSANRIEGGTGSVGATDIAPGVGVDSDRHDDLDAAAHVDACRETARTRADADRERVAGAARLEQR